MSLLCYQCNKKIGAYISYNDSEEREVKIEAIICEECANRNLINFYY